MRSRAWVEVDGGAIRRNLEVVRSHVGQGARVVPIVKCDGYGLGAGLVVEALAPARPFAYGVATVDEGRTLRALGVRVPVMVLCPAPPGDLARMARARLVPTISELESLGVLANAAMHVQGFADQTPLCPIPMPIGNPHLAPQPAPQPTGSPVLWSSLLSRSPLGTTYP